MIKNNSIFQLLLVMAGFLSLWFGLYQADFMTLLNVKDSTKVNEEKLGALMLDLTTTSYPKVRNKAVLQKINYIKNTICSNNNIDTNSIKIHVFESSTVNAFALPGRQIVVFSSLITQTNNAEELASVMAHEIAHTQLNHVMKKVSKEIGVNMLATLAGGTSGSSVITNALKNVASKAYDRSIEEEADVEAVTYLVNAKINPAGFSDFLFTLADLGPDLPDELEWMSTHPDAKDRAANVLKLNEKNKNVVFKPLFSKDEWDALKSQL